MVNSTKLQGEQSRRLSPGDELRLKHAERRKDLAFLHLAVALMKGDVVGDDVTRLHKAISESGGDPLKLGSVEWELSKNERNAQFMELMVKMARDNIR